MIDYQANERPRHPSPRVRDEAQQPIPRTTEAKGETG